MSPDPEPLRLVTRTPRHRSIKWSAVDPDEIAAWVAELDFEVAEPIRVALVRAVEASDLGYPPLDDPVLSEAVAGWYTQQFGYRFDPERVVLLPDVMRGVTLAIELWSAPGEGVLTTTPVYPPFLQATAESGRRLVAAPLAAGRDRYELDLDAFAQGLRDGARVVLLSNPHNPTGRVFSRDELAAIGRLVIEHGAWLVADEIHAPLVLPGAAHTPVASLSPEIAARTLTLTSASKGWNVPGVKVGIAICGDDAMRERFRHLAPDALFGASPLGVHATVAALTEGQAWLSSLLAVLDGNRRLLSALLAERLPGVGYRTPEAGYLAWLDVRALPIPPGDRAAAWFQREARVRLSAGEDFGEPGQGHVRLNFGTSPDVLTEMVRRLAQATARAPVGSSGPTG